jgi:hypothetical protein
MGISHWMCPASNRVHFSYDSYVWSILFHPISPYTGAGKLTVGIQSEFTQKSRNMSGGSLFAKSRFRVSCNVLCEGLYVVFIGIDDSDYSLFDMI